MGIEMPFGDDANDLPMQNMMKSMNDCLALLLNPKSQRPPRMSPIGPEHMTVGVVDWKVPDEKQRVEDIDELGNISYRVGEDHTQFRLRLTEIKETSAKCTIAKEPEKEHTEGTIEQSVTECVEANGGLQAKLQERLCLSIERIIGFLDSQFDTFRLLCENSGSLAEDVKKLRKTTEEQGLRYSPIQNQFQFNLDQRGADQSRLPARSRESPIPPVPDEYSCRRILPGCGGVERAQISRT